MPTPDIPMCQPNRSDVIAQPENIRCGAQSVRPADFVPGAWRDDRLLVLDIGASLPSRCVRCDEESDGRPMRVKLTGGGTSWGLLEVLNPDAYRTFTVHVFLCPRHRLRRVWCNVVGVSVMAVGVVLMACGLIDNGSVTSGKIDERLAVLPVFRGLILLTAGAITWGLGRSGLSVVKSERTRLWIAGVSRELLSRLPRLQADGT